MLKKEYIKIAVIDDSPICIKDIQSLVKKHCPNIEITGSFNNPEKALRELPKLKPDLLLLDVEMPDMNGFQLLEKCTEFSGGVIFITAHGHYALQAFKFSAVDYLVKPVQKDELIKAFAKYDKMHQAKPANNNLQELASNINLMAQGQLGKIAISTFTGIEIIRIDEIIYIKAEGNYACIKRQGQKDLLVAKTLKDFEGTLVHLHFSRVHNAYLINMDKVTRYMRVDGGCVEMEDGTKIDISRSHKENFLKMFKA